MNHQSFRHGVRLAAVAAAACVSLSAQAGLVTWTITGPGTSSASQTGNTAALNYSQPGSAGFASQTWAIRAVADTSGSFDFDWDYTGFHSYFQVTAFLTTTLGDTLVNAGPTNCCSSPSAGFALQFNPDASNPAGWLIHGGGISDDGVMRSVLYPIASAPRFFRLRSP